MDSIKICGFKNIYADYFYKLNKFWITEHWELEKSDLQDLLNPQKSIIDLGGEVFFVLKNNTPIGTVAMIPASKKKYELAKMTIKKEFRGMGYSKLLLDRCIEFAKNKKASEIYLISNRKLKIARKLYDIYGFKEIKLDSLKYTRGDVKMALSIN